MLRQLGLVLLLGTFASTVLAAQIDKVKGAKVLVRLAGESASVGDYYYGVKNSKKLAKLKIFKIQGENAIANLVAGHAEVGMTLVRAPAPKAGSRQAQRGSGGGSTVRPSGRSYWGFMLGFAMDSMSAQVNNYLPPGNSRGNVAMAGTGYAVSALIDYQLFDQVWFRGTGGLEAFNVTGSAECGVNNAQGCNASINYFALDFTARYVFSQGAYRPWIGLGLGLLFPATKSATALASGSIGTTNVLLAEGGLDWFINPTMYIPISVEYGYLPKSDQVSANWIAVRAGLAFPF